MPTVAQRSILDFAKRKKVRVADTAGSSNEPADPTPPARSSAAEAEAAAGDAASAGREEAADSGAAGGSNVSASDGVLKAADQCAVEAGLQENEAERCTGMDANAELNLSSQSLQQQELLAKTDSGHTGENKGDDEEAVLVAGGRGGKKSNSEGGNADAALVGAGRGTKEASKEEDAAADKRHVMVIDDEVAEAIPVGRSLREDIFGESDSGDDSLSDTGTGSETGRGSVGSCDGGDALDSSREEREPKVGSKRRGSSDLKPDGRKRRRLSDEERERREKEKQMKKKKREEEREAARREKEEKQRQKAEAKRQREEAIAEKRRLEQEEKERRKRQREEERKAREEKKRLEQEAKEKAKEERRLLKLKKEEEARRAQEEREEKEREERDKREAEEARKSKQRQVLANFFVTAPPSDAGASPSAQVSTSKVVVGRPGRWYQALELLPGTIIAPVCKKGPRSQADPLRQDAAAAVEEFRAMRERGRASARRRTKTPSPLPAVPHLSRMKLWKFNEGRQYFGTFSIESEEVNGRRPFAMDKSGGVDYEEESDDEMEEEPLDGESLSDDGEEDDEDDDEGDDNMSGFLIPNGYLSDEEGVNQCAEDKIVRKITQEKSVETLQKLQPVILGPVFDLEASDPCYAEFAKYRIQTISALPEPEVKGAKREALIEAGLLYAGKNIDGERSIQSVLAKLQNACPGMTKTLGKVIINQIAEKIKLPGESVRKYYVRDEHRGTYGLKPLDKTTPPEPVAEPDAKEQAKAPLDAFFVKEPAMASLDSFFTKKTRPASSTSTSSSQTGAEDAQQEQQQ
eukprot:TRINITY_DN6610_c0_g1_i1.p1 TRINITY_DN6610_c0_g1~~TRINITY_DN6610_c0_g1_i1.p1  ORF type:complete len:804 (-),score=256.03 TRINITY_DN6610_c0_g1_i1:214-2625(-)